MSTTTFDLTKPVDGSLQGAHPRRGLDNLDLRLVGELVKGRTLIPLDNDFRRSFRTLAKTLRTDEDTVRSRMKRLHDLGFFLEWHTWVNPSVLGLAMSIVWFDVAVSVPKKELISKLQLISEVVSITNFYGGTLAIIFIHPSDRSLRRSLALFRELSGASEITLGHFAWPESKIQMTKADWKIVRSLRYDPRRSSIAISQDTGLSAGTIRRRLGKMSEQRVLFAFPRLGPCNLGGTVIATLLVCCDVGADSHDAGGRMKLHLREHLWNSFSIVTPKETAVQYFWFDLAMPNVSTVAEELEWARKQSYVKNARVGLQEEHYISSEYLDEYLDSQLREASTGNP